MHSVLRFVSSFPVFVFWITCAGAELTHYSGVGIMSCGVFNATFLLNGSDERQQSDRIRQLDVWAVCRGLKPYLIHNWGKKFSK